MRFLKAISLILLFVFFASFLIHPLFSINQDIGRHIKSGEIIWQTKNVYKTNLFSFTEPNRPFINHHWLSEVIFFGLNNLIGLQGLIIFKTLVLLLALRLLYLAVKNGSEYWAFLLSAGAGIMVWTERTDVRPEIFSYLFLAFFLFAIFRAKYPTPSYPADRHSEKGRAWYGAGSNQAKWLYFLPIIQIFWTNMHIYFVIGPILLLFFIIDQRIKYWKLFLVTCAVTLLNPNLLSGAFYPLMVLRDYGYSIVENQNIFFLSDYGVSIRSIQLFQASLAVFVLGFIMRKRIAVFELLSGIFFSIMAIKMLRNFGPYGLAFIPLTTVNLSVLKINKKKETVLLIIVSAILLSITIYNFKNNVSLAIPTGAEKAVAFVRENNIQGPVFNNFDVGSYLIWKLYPQQKVFVDGRPEAYSPNFFEEIYKPMQMDPRLWDQYSKKYGINYVFFDHRDITPWARVFLGYISKNPDWPRVYADEYIVIFTKRK